MSVSDTAYYLITAALTFLVATWLGDQQVMQGFSIGVALVVCLCNQEKWGHAAEAWARRRLGL